MGARPNRPTIAVGSRVRFSLRWLRAVAAGSADPIASAVGTVVEVDELRWAAIAAVRWDGGGSATVNLANLTLTTPLAAFADAAADERR